MHKDVIVVGAGISGIAAGYNLQKSCPNKSFAILEGRESLGGTWDLFKYPGIRSDSDMHTLGFRFKPWIHKKSIADGPSILEYLNETVDEYDLRKDNLGKEMKDKFSKLEKLIIPLLIKLAKSPEAYIHWPNRAQVIEAQVKKIIAITRGK